MGSCSSKKKKPVANQPTDYMKKIEDGMNRPSDQVQKPWWPKEQNFAIVLGENPSKAIQLLKDGLEIKKADPSIDQIEIAKSYVCLTTATLLSRQPVTEAEVYANLAFPILE